MKPFKLTCIAVIICGAMSGNAMAAKKIVISEEEEAKNQASLEIDGINTVATPEMVAESDSVGAIRDSLRTNFQIDNLRIDDLNNKSKITAIDRELAVNNFINDNVPAHVLALGDKAISSYITEHFTLDATTPKGIQKQTVWSSSSDVLSIPQPAPSAWAPSVSTVTESPKITPTVGVSSAPEEKSGMVVSDKNQKEALEILNMDQEDLDKLFNGSVKKETAKPVEPKAEPKAEIANVVISQINITQLVMIGDHKFIDADVKFEVLKSGASRDVQRSFKELKPGSIFKVENDRFELSSISGDQVVFENLDKRKTFTANVE